MCLVRVCVCVSKQIQELSLVSYKVVTVCVRVVTIIATGGITTACVLCLVEENCCEMTPFLFLSTLTNTILQGTSTS